MRLLSSFKNYLPFFNLQLNQANDSWYYVWGSPQFSSRHAYKLLIGHHQIHHSFIWLWTSACQNKRKCQIKRYLVREGRTCCLAPASPPRGDTDGRPNPSCHTLFFPSPPTVPAEQTASRVVGLARMEAMGLFLAHAASVVWAAISWRGAPLLEPRGAPLSGLWRHRRGPKHVQGGGGSPLSPLFASFLYAPDNDGGAGRGHSGAWAAGSGALVARSGTRSNALRPDLAPL